jgi:hypothetical protein
MKNLFNWIGGFFSSESGTSSKRLVGIIGAIALFYTMFDNSKSESTYIPADSLVWATFALSAVALGLTTIESVTSLIKGFKGKDENENK